jgi:hypothetical protein
MEKRIGTIGSLSALIGPFAAVLFGSTCADHACWAKVLLTMPTPCGGFGHLPQRKGGA